jgi:hypothetical protein
MREGAAGCVLGYTSTFIEVNRQTPESNIAGKTPPSTCWYHQPLAARPISRDSTALKIVGRDTLGCRTGNIPLADETILHYIALALATTSGFNNERTCSSC